MGSVNNHLSTIEENTKRFIRRLSYHISSPRKFFLLLTSGRIPWFRIPVSDELYIKVLYKEKTGETLRLNPPILLNEKLQWLKLFNRNPKYSLYADKYRVRDYIANTIGEKYLIPQIGVWEKVEDINFETLPDKFVLKCNHNSSDGMVVCTDKSKVNWKKASKELKKALKVDYFYLAREWAYKGIKRCIIGEEFLENADGSPLVDYKFYCYGGKPQYFMYSLGEADHHVRNHKFDMELNSIDYLFKPKPAIDVKDITLPSNMGEMITIVEKLCRGFPHIRIDLYNVDGHIYFGEMTFFTSGGIINIYSQEYAQKMADLIDIDGIQNGRL